MTRLTTFLVGLLRRLLSSTLVAGSIRRLLHLIHIFRRRFSKGRTPHPKDSRHTFILPSSQTSPATSFAVTDVICPSLQPPREADSNSLHVPYAHDEQYVPRPVHSPTPQRGYLLPYAYEQDIGTSTQKERNPDTISVSSQRSAKTSSAISLLPVSQHGLTRRSYVPDSRNSSCLSLLRPGSRNSQRPNSRASQPIKVSRAPTPESINSANMAQPAGARPSSPPPLRIVAPMSTASIQRYDRNYIISTKYTFVMVDPLKFDYVDDDILPFGWIQYTHPEGARYFCHKEKRIYTDANLYDPEELLIISESANQILGDLEIKARDDNVELPSDIELAVEVIPTEEGPICGYYFINHKSRCLFWLEEFDAEGICSEINAVVSLSHLRYEIEAQYWAHWELFPNTRDVTVEIVDRLRSITLYAAADTLTSSTSTAAWSTEENRIILSLLSHTDTSPDNRDGNSAWVIGRMMRNFIHNQFLNLYGQRGARVDRHQSVHGSIVNPRTLLVVIFSPLLFWAPDVHLEALEKIWVDHLVHLGPWTQFINKLNSEWQEFIIIATVLLNANMAFLSIQSVDNGGQVVEDRSPAQIASYISIVTSVGSVILSLLLVRQNRSTNRQLMDKAAKLLGRLTHEKRGLETLAILYALPYALLMWSTLSFLAAFMIACFSFASSTTRLSVGAFLVAVSLLILWCIRTSWVNEYNVATLELPSRADLWNKCRAIFSHGGEPATESREPRKNILSRLGIPPSDALWNKCKAIFSRGGNPDTDSGETLGAPASLPTIESSKRQQSWPMRIFVRKATTDHGSGSTGNEGERVDV